MRPALTRHETSQLASVLSALLSPTSGVGSDEWPTAVASALRTLIGAPMAVFAIEDSHGKRLYGDRLDDRVLRDYESHFHEVDLGTRRQRALGIELWSRELLWGRHELSRSEYYHDFALPHGLRDAFGLGAEVHARGECVHARVALLHDQPVRPGAAARQLALLSLIRPAFRTGVGAHVQAARGDVSADWALVTPLLDATEHPEALYGIDGRLLHRNAAMARALERASDALREACEHVVRTSRAARARGGDDPAVPSAVALLMTTSSAYRVQGRVIEAGPAGVPAAGAVLVSLHRSPPDPPDADELRRRFGLTPREAEIARLLVRRRSNAEIARTLSLSRHTVRHHSEHILHKLGVHSRGALGELLARH